MSSEKLKYLSNITVENLRGSVVNNLSRYTAGDFNDMIWDGDWSLELGLPVDLAPLQDLVPEDGEVNEINNSKLVWRALGGLTPALAFEEGIWTRLTHVECLEFSRKRWLQGKAPEKIQGLVDAHFFANTLNKRRDDNAISRLWWNAYIAEMVCPNTGLSALDILLKKADIRANIVERPLTGSRPSLASGIVRIMRTEPWLTEKEANWRAFMRVLNRLGGGVLFEVMTEHQIDAFMRRCAGLAGMPQGGAAN